MNLQSPIIYVSTDEESAIILELAAVEQKCYICGEETLPGLHETEKVYRRRGKLWFWRRTCAACVSTINKIGGTMKDQ